VRTFYVTFAEHLLFFYVLIVLTVIDFGFGIGVDIEGPFGKAETKIKESYTPTPLNLMLTASYC